MRSPRSWRLAAACRLAVSSLILAAPLAAPALAAAADAISGIVVDQAGNALPRASVRVLTGGGRSLAGTFTDEAGRFRFAVAETGCTVEAALTGFEPARVACETTPLRLALAVAPIEETVVVTATRTEAPAGLVGASVTAFTAADLERRRAPLVADLLRTSPGATIVQSGGLGNLTSLFVRGGESNHNKVLLDGIPLNEPGGTFNFSNVTTAGLERVEIVRGAQSALFGSDAMASVIQLFTKQAERAAGLPQVIAAFEAGTFATLRGEASVSGRAGPADYVVSGSRLNTDNQAKNNAFDNTTLSANAGIRVAEGAALRLVGRGELERVGVPGATAFGRPDLDAFFDRQDAVGGISFTDSSTLSVRHRASYALAVTRQQSSNLVVDPPYVPRFESRSAPFTFSDFRNETVNHLRRHHASYQADWRLTSAARAGDHLLTLLADWDGERANLENRLSGARTHATRDNLGVSAQHQATWTRIAITGGGRIERNDSFGYAFVPRGSGVLVARRAGRLMGETRLRASGGLGIKEPTVLQSFSLSPFFLGNPDLEPERSRSIEGGIEQRFASDRGRVEATWFANRFRNLISTRTTNPELFTAQYFNIGLTRARGLELAGRVTTSRNLDVRAGYTFLDSEVLESTAPGNVVFREGEWLFRRPRHSGYVGVTLEWRNLVTDLSAVFVGRFVDSDFASLEPPLTINPGRETVDARVSYRLSRRLTLQLAIDNATDAKYMEPLGYPALGRAIRAGARVSF